MGRQNSEAWTPNALKSGVASRSTVKQGIVVVVKGRDGTMKTKIQLLLFIVFVVLGAEAVWLDLPSSGTKCVSEEIHPNVVVLADYSVIYEGHTHSSITIAVKVSFIFRFRNQSSEMVRSAS